MVDGFLELLVASSMHWRNNLHLISRTPGHSLHAQVLLFIPTDSPVHSYQPCSDLVVTLTQTAVMLRVCVRQSAQ